MTIVKTLDSAKQRDRKALEELVIDNPDLERLEALLDQFNIFEAIGAVRQELRHSDFLAFIMDPQQPHGLGDLVLKGLLQKVLQSTVDAPLPISLIDLDVWNLEETTVLREWRSIDVLAINEPNQLVVILENKIGSTEHSDQLKRYYDTVQQYYPNWRIVGLYLTPEGHAPSHEAYLPVSYRQVAELIENLLSRKASTMGVDVQTVMSHYLEMLRRHIVSDSEIDILCKRIYRKHQRALDLIFERRPKHQDEVAQVLLGLVQGTEGLVIDRWVGNSHVFLPAKWDKVISPNTEYYDGNWSSGNRILVFWFEMIPQRIRLILEIIPGPVEVRQRLFDIACKHKPPFRPGSRELSPKYNRIWNKQLLGKGWMDQVGDPKLELKLRGQWENFVQHDLPELSNIIITEISDNN